LYSLLNIRLAGGGGGGGRYSAGAGGLGGGGAGSIADSGTNSDSGTINTGGGGGGKGVSPIEGTTAGSGGSGVVYVSYPAFFPQPKAITGSPTVTLSGGFRIYRFTGSGSITF
jgi:hypothetical protein